MEKRIGVIGIVIDDPKESSKEVNTILSDFGHIIVGRMGIPYKSRNVAVISLVVDGTNDEIGALTGKLGRIHGVNAKSVLSNKKLEEKSE